MLIRSEFMHVDVGTNEKLYELLEKLFYKSKNIGRVTVNNKAEGGYEVTYEVKTEEKPKQPETITPDYYQKLCRRTQNESLTNFEKTNHALFGLASETGEIHSLFQHMYQGKSVDKDKVVDECGDLCWFLCELLDTFHVDFSDVLKYNIDKLKKRFPNGFDAERSDKRHELE